MQEISLCGIFSIIKNFCHSAGRQKPPGILIMRREIFGK